MSTNYSDLARLSAVETLRALDQPDQVTLADLVAFLESRDMWDQFSQVTLSDFRQAFAPIAEATPKKRKRVGIGKEISGDEPTPRRAAEPVDGGLSTDEVARQVLPFVEGNGDVSFDDIADYTRLDRKVLRHHLGKLVKESLLERIGTGRSAIYSTTG